MAESVSSAHQVFPGGGSAFYKGGRTAHGAFGGDFVQSDLRATEEELEQAVRVEKRLAGKYTVDRYFGVPIALFIASNSVNCLALEKLVDKALVKILSRRNTLMVEVRVARLLSDEKAYGYSIQYNMPQSSRDLCAVSGRTSMHRWVRSHGWYVLLGMNMERYAATRRLSHDQDAMVETRWIRLRSILSRWRESGKNCGMTEQKRCARCVIVFFTVGVHTVQTCHSICQHLMASFLYDTQAFPRGRSYFAILCLRNTNPSLRVSAVPVTGDGIRYQCYRLQYQSCYRLSVISYIMNTSLRSWPIG